MNYYIYTDGSARNNGQKNNYGAWGWVCVSEDDSRLDGRAVSTHNTTNQRMELMGAVDALESMLPFLKEEDTVIVYTDSAYLHNCYTQKWYDNWEKNGWQTTKRRPVVNADLWERLIPFFKNDFILFEKVKGHSDGETRHEKWNNYVDKIVQEASKKAKDENCNN